MGLDSMMGQTIPLDIVHTDLVYHLFHCIHLQQLLLLAGYWSIDLNAVMDVVGYLIWKRTTLFVSLFRTTTTPSPVLSYEMPPIHCSNSAENSADMLLDDSRA